MIKSAVFEVRQNPPKLPSPQGEGLGVRSEEGWG